MSRLSRADLREKLNVAALELGFDAIGVASATEPIDDRERLLSWLTRGFHASMAWMARDPERRADVRKVLPDARSVISLAINYYHDPSPDESAGSLKVSRYAWGEDYHRIVGQKLKDLQRRLDELAPEQRSVTYVDTGPIMEKAWAERAGIGWIGKNGNLITRGFGSWVFLGEIITTAELPVDEHHTDFCGSCTRCIEACPTDAIVEPYVVDSNKCISYWTIEHRGDFPPGIGDDFDGWIFGCDICQDVCPWNRFSRPSGEAAFQPRAGCLHPPADQWREMTEEEFRSEFGDSTIRRTKRAGLARNIRAQDRDPLPQALRSIDWEPPDSLTDTTEEQVGEPWRAPVSKSS